MALWEKSESSTSAATPAPIIDPAPPVDPPVVSALSKAVPLKSRGELQESLIAAGLTIEGKINGKGHLRVAGKFKGDIHVEGDLHIDTDAKVEGQVTADQVIVNGELQGNIENARHVELKQGGSVTGDIKATSVVVAVGARMRGNVDFGFDEKSSKS
jgi:cytoskeletal protein CcmA (bactofilin family)